MGIFDGIMIGITVGFTIGSLCVAIDIQTNNILITDKYLIDNGYAIYNSKKQLVIKDEYRKYYNINIE